MCAAERRIGAALFLVSLRKGQALKRLTLINHNLILVNHGRI